MARKTEKTEPSSFWKRLVETWKEQGLPTTQAGVARTLKAAGYEVKGQSTTQRWHDGSSLPGKASIMIALADKGRTSIDYLITGRPPKYPKPPDAETAELLGIWGPLDRDGRKHVLEAAHGQALRVQEVRAAAPDQKSPGRKSG